MKNNNHDTIIQLLTVCRLYLIVTACFVVPSLFLDVCSVIRGVPFSHLNHLSSSILEHAAPRMMCNLQGIQTD